MGMLSSHLRAHTVTDNHCATKESIELRHSRRRRIQYSKYSHTVNSTRLNLISSMPQYKELKAAARALDLADIFPEFGFLEDVTSEEEEYG